MEVTGQVKQLEAELVMLLCNADSIDEIIAFTAETT